MKRGVHITGDNIYEGMAVKLKLPRVWAGFGNPKKQYVWMVGRIKKVVWPKLIEAGPDAGRLSRCGCVIDCFCRSGHRKYWMRGLMCSADMANIFRNMYKLKRDS